MAEEIGLLKERCGVLVRNKEEVVRRAIEGIEGLKQTERSLKELGEGLRESIINSNATNSSIIDKIKTQIKEIGLNSRNFEEKKSEKVEIRKSVIPASFKKKASIAVRKEEIDLEKELGNSYS